MAARWRVTNNTFREELDGSGKFVPSREISFEILDNGHTGQVIIPIRNLDPTYVAQVIQGQADQLLAISSLTSEG
jgi:hypothetical protein